MSSVGTEPVTSASHPHAALRRPAAAGAADKPETSFDAMLDSALPERSPPERTEQPPPTVPAERAPDQVAGRDAVTTERAAAERPVDPATGEQPTDVPASEAAIPVAALIPAEALLPIPTVAPVPVAVIPEVTLLAGAPAVPGDVEPSPNPPVLPAPETAVSPVPQGAAALPEPAVVPVPAGTAPAPAADVPKPVTDAAAAPVDVTDMQAPAAPTRPEQADIPLAADKKPVAAPDAPPVKAASADLAARNETAAAPVQPVNDRSPAQAAPATVPEGTSEDLDAPLDPDAKPAEGTTAAARERHADAMPASAKPSAGPTEAPLNPAPPAASSATSHDTAQPLNLTPTPAAVANGGPAAAASATSGPNPAAAYAPAVAISGLAVEIVARARDGMNRFEIRLDPPELGRIDVHLQMDRDGNVTSRLYVERSETLDLLRRDAPQLERALNHAGLKTSDQGMEFSLRDQGFGRDPGAREEPGVNRLIIPDELQPVTTAGSFYGRRLGLGAGIDIRV